MSKSIYRAALPGLQARLAAIQQNARALELPVVILVEGGEASGKGDVLQDLVGGLDPLYTRVHVFSQVNARDDRYPWMRPYWLALPDRGDWAVFELSWYRRVLDERLHQDSSEKEWRQAYRDILDLERTLTEDGYLFVKLFLQLDRQEQSRRLERRRKHRLEHRRPTPRQWEQNHRFADWQAACEEMFAQTDTRWAPWHLIPANNQRFARLRALLCVVNDVNARVGVPPLAETLEDYLATLEIDVLSASEPAVDGTGPPNNINI